MPAKSARRNFFRRPILNTASISTATAASTCATASPTCWPPPPTSCTPTVSRWADLTTKAARISRRCASGTTPSSTARRSAISPISWSGDDSLSSRRTPGPIRRGGREKGSARCLPCPRRINEHRWLWVPAFAGTTVKVSVRGGIRASLPRFLRSPDPLRQHRPVAGGPKALQQVHEDGVVADQDARLVLFDALDDAQGGGLGRGPRDRIEPLDRLRPARIVGDACAGAGVADDVGGDAAGMHHRELYRAVRHRQFMPKAFRKTAYREFRRGIGGLARRGDDPKDARDVDDVGLFPLRQMRQEGAGAMHHAPEIDVDQPFHLRLLDFVELAEQRDAGIVDDDAEVGMGRYGRGREVGDLPGLADVNAMQRDFLFCADFSRNRLQPGLVAIGQRQVAAARGKLDRQRPADAARGAGDGGGS